MSRGERLYRTYTGATEPCRYRDRQAVEDGYNAGRLDGRLGQLLDVCWIHFPSESDWHKDYVTGYRAGWTGSIREVNA